MTGCASHSIVNRPFQLNANRVELEIEKVEGVQTAVWPPPGTAPNIAPLDTSPILLASAEVVLPNNAIANAPIEEIADPPTVVEASNLSLAEVSSDRRSRYAEWINQYVIEAGDSLEFKFRASKELNDVVTVRPDGMISLQWIGDIPAAGLTAEQLRQSLVQAYSADLIDPDITVIVRSFSGNSIFVGGEVVSSGRVPLTGRITTLRAIILAGGFKDTADPERVRVRRGDGSCCEYDLRSVVECTSQGQDVQLQPNDVVYVPKSRIAKVNLFVEQYIDKVLPFSRSFGVFVSHNTGLPSAVNAGP